MNTYRVQSTSRVEGTDVETKLNKSATLTACFYKTKVVIHKLNKKNFWPWVLKPDRSNEGICLANWSSS